MESNEDKYIAYCAGLFEGEGHIRHMRYRNKKGTSYSNGIRLTIKMNDLEPLEMFQEFMDVGIICGPYTRYPYDSIIRQPCYSYDIANYKDVKSVVDVIYAWLSPRRKKQCDDAFKEFLKYSKKFKVVA